MKVLYETLLSKSSLNSSWTIANIDITYNSDKAALNHFFVTEAMFWNEFFIKRTMLHISTKITDYGLNCKSFSPAFQKYQIIYPTIYKMRGMWCVKGAVSQTTFMSTSDPNHQLVCLEPFCTKNSQPCFNLWKQVIY